MARKVKRMVIGGETKVIKYEYEIMKNIFVEKDDDIYNIYFPQNAEQNIYILGLSAPVAILDAFVAAKIEDNLNKVAKEFTNKKIKSALPEMKEEDKK